MGQWCAAGREENGHAVPPPPPPGAPASFSAKPPRPSSQHHASSSASASRSVLRNAVRGASTCSFAQAVFDLSKDRSLYKRASQFES